MQGHEHGSEFLQVVHSFPIFLKCPVEGDPIPQIFWFDGNDREKSIKESDDVTIFENELWIKAANASNSRTYVCLAENPVGQIIYTFNVSVIGEFPQLLIRDKSLVTVFFGVFLTN